LVQALVITRLDDCNSLVAGLPASAIKSLQRIHNAAACLVFNLPKFSHVTPLFRDFHWLPVIARIRFKKLIAAYKAVSGTAPHPLPRISQSSCPSLSAPLTHFSRLVPRSLRKGETGKNTSLPTLNFSLFWHRSGAFNTHHPVMHPDTSSVMFPGFLGCFGFFNCQTPSSRRPIWGGSSPGLCPGNSSLLIHSDEATLEETSAASVTNLLAPVPLLLLVGLGPLHPTVLSVGLELVPSGDSKHRGVTPGLAPPAYHQG